MIPINLNITMQADDRRLTAHLDKLPETLRKALRPKIQELTDALLSEVHALEPVRTGRLRAATQEFVDETETRIAGKVRVVGQTSDIHRIAGALEYGTHVGSVAVKSYIRQSGPVRGYDRRVNIEAQRFMRGPAATLRTRALAEIEETITTALQIPG